MAWESRIQSESRRRFVVTALMVCLLAGSTAVALIYSRARRPEPVLTLHHAFTLRMPDGYYRVAPTANPSARTNVLRHSGNVRGPIHVRFYPNQGFAQPLEVCQRARKELGWMSGSAEGQMYHEGPLQVLMFASQGERVSGGRPQTFSEVLAVATVDGSAYLAIHHKARGPLDPEDTARIREMALSIRDTRYAAIDERQVTLGGARIDVPQQMAAYRPVQPSADKPPAVCLAPTTGERFYRLVVYALPAEALPAVAGEPLAQTVERLLLSHVPKLENAPAPAGTVETVDIDGRPVQVAHFALGQTIPQRYHEWALALGESHVLCIRIIADKNTQGVAEQAARRVVASAHPAPDASPPPSEQGSKE